MQMIEVLKKLAELDDANGGVKESTKMVSDQSLAVISESVEVNECGPMGMPGMAPAGQPASFSINASASSGDEVANMLTQIMTLAGVKSGPMDKDGDKKEPLNAVPPMAPGNDIKAAINAIDQVEKETDAIGGMDSDSKLEMETDAIPGDGEPADVADMAQDVKDMADELKGKDKEDLGLEALDNSPQQTMVSKDPLSDFAYQLNKLRSFEYTPPNSGSNPLKAESVETKEEAVQEGTQDQSLLSITNDLMKKYEAFKAQ